MEESFLFVLNILNFAHRMHISSSFILHILIGLAVEHYGDAMFYYFLLADNSGCYTCFFSSSPHVLISQTIQVR